MILVEKTTSNQLYFVKLCINVINFFQESDSPPSTNAAIQLHPLTLASVQSVIQMATDLRAAHPAGFIHTTPQVGSVLFGRLQVAEATFTLANIFLIQAM